MKVVYLAIQAATKKWTMPIRNWKPAMNELNITPDLFSQFMKKGSK